MSKVPEGLEKFLKEFAATVRSSVADRVEERLKAFEERQEGKGSQGASIAQAAGENGQMTPTRRTFARAAFAVAFSGYSRRADDMEPCKATEAAAKLWPGDEGVQKALTSGDLSSGGAFVDGGYRESFIDLLTPRVAVRAHGPVLTPMPEGSLTIAKVTSDVTAYYVGESQPATKSEPGTGAVKLSAKKLSTLVPISNSLIRRAARGRVPHNVEAWVERMAVRRQGIREDQAFLRGPGTEHSPKGLRFLARAANVIAANSTVNFTNILADLGKVIGALEDADVPMTKPGWILAPRTRNYLRFQALDGNQQPFFLRMLQSGELLGYPVQTSSSMPTNLGSGTDESEIILADFDQVLLGESEDMEVTTSAEASYREGGALVSAFERDETVLRVISEHDLGVEHDEAIAVLDEVTWGA